MMDSLRIFPSKPYKGHYVAEIDGKIVGVCQLKYKGQEMPKKDNSNRDRELIGAYGFRRMIKLMLFGTIIAYKPKKGECYLENLVVSKNFRGHGIGSSLMTQAKEFTLEHDFDQLTLHVSMANNGAKALYKSKGFETKKIKMIPRYYQRQWQSEGFEYMVLTI